MLDFVQFALETIANILKHGWSPAMVVMSLVALIRVRRIRKKLIKRFPWLNGDDSETQHYIANQARIEAKIDALSAHMGVQQCGLSGTEKTGHQSLDRSSTTSSKVTLANRYLYPYLRRVKKMSKFKSRKFILAVVSAILIVLNDGLDLGIDSETVLAFAGLVAVWITGESVVDAKRAGSNEVSKEEQSYH